MHATHITRLAVDHLLDAVRQVHIFPEMENKCLLALGQFCDNGYEVHLTKTEIFITHMLNPAMSLKGNRDPITKM